MVHGGYWDNFSTRPPRHDESGAAQAAGFILHTLSSCLHLIQGGCYALLVI